MKPVTKHLSIAICSHNRSGYLVRAIKSVLDAPPAGLDWELIIVLNACKDDSLSKVGLALSDYADVRGAVIVVEESEIGLSAARNRALKEASGKLLAYLDDDAVAFKGWAESLYKAYEDHSACVVGGKIEPVWEAPKPRWLPDNLVVYFTVLDWGSETKVLDLSRECVAGANIGFDTGVLRAHNGFSTLLGRVGKLLLSNEETIAIQEIAADTGRPVVYCGNAVVGHSIQASRLNPSWLIRRIYSQGISDGVAQLQGLGIYKNYPHDRPYSSLRKIISDWSRLRTVFRLALGYVVARIGYHFPSFLVGDLYALGYSHSEIFLERFLAGRSSVSLNANRQ